MSGDLINHVEELNLQEDHIENQRKGEEDQVDPWNVVSKSEAGIDYDKLIREYLCNFSNLQFLIFMILWQNVNRKYMASLT